MAKTKNAPSLVPFERSLPRHCDSAGDGSSTKGVGLRTILWQPHYGIPPRLAVLLEGVSLGRVRLSRLRAALERFYEWVWCLSYVGQFNNQR